MAARHAISPENLISTNLGVTQRSLAKRLGKLNSHVSLIERGQRRIDCLELYKIAQALSMDPEVLFREVDESLKSAA